MTKKIIAYQGSVGANSNIACDLYYQDYDQKSYATFYDIFHAVQNGEVDCGMIPLENSYAGRVSEIHTLLQSSSLSIVAEHFLPIEHNLASINGTKIEDILEVYSHPQALMQCQNSLQDFNLKFNEFSNTAMAAKYIASSNDKTKAAICSKKAAKLYNLAIIKESIQDSKNDNVTIFIVIAKEPVDVDPDIAPVITTLLFGIRNIPGSLYKALGGLATNNVSMLKLESYIPGGYSNQAKFIISIEGHPSQRNVALALEEMGFFSKNVKLLGIYYADKMRSNNKE